jgi:hypothetical protein
MGPDNQNCILEGRTRDDADTGGRMSLFQRQSRLNQDLVGKKCRGGDPREESGARAPVPLRWFGSRGSTRSD